MTLKRWDGASYIDLTILKRWDGAAFVDITTAKRWDGTAFVDITLSGGGGLSVTADVGGLSGSFHATGPYPLFQTVYSSGSVTVTPTGGTGPYTYSWTHLSGYSALQVVSPSSAITQFVANVGRDQVVEGVKRCTVTDSLGATAYVDISGTLIYTTDI